MKNYLMWDEDTGEDFIVEAENAQEAYEKACEYFANPHLDGEISDFEAEMLGLDTY